MEKVTVQLLLACGFAGLCQLAHPVHGLVEGTDQTSGVQQFPELREGKSLLNTFPFNLQEVEQDIDNLHAKQLSEVEVTFDAVAKAGSGLDGDRRCIEKVVMEEETEWDDLVTCEHSYNRRCHQSQITIYNAAQEEECEENYVKDCDRTGEEICSTQYESECITTQEEHQVEDDIPQCETIVDEKCEQKTSGYTSFTDCSKWPREVCTLEKQLKKKFTPITRCDKVPVELCGPVGCGFKEGAEVCRDRTQTVVHDKPQETCSLDPRTTCKHVTKLVPQLKEVENCIDVPKEVCVRSRANPRKVNKPVIKIWCYGGVEVCPEECLEAARQGDCLPQCEQYSNIRRCCAKQDTPPPPPPCSNECLTAARNNQCLPQCERYRDNYTD